MNLSRHVCVCVLNLLFSKEADEAKLCVFLLVFQQLSHSIAQIKQHAAFGCEELTNTHTHTVLLYFSRFKKKMTLQTFP